MKAIKRVFLVVLSVAIIAGIILVLYKKLQEQRILNIVSSGQVTIDQEMHDWGVCKYNRPVKIEMYVRNNGQYQINGTLVFSASLAREGLEEKFVRKFIDCYGEEKLKKEMAEEIAKKGSLGRLEAVYNYLLRGKQLPQGQNFEPSESEMDNKDYAFKFRKQILIYPGEIFKIDHEEQIPLNARGHILTVKIENIEF
jgi:hypothetical protein